MRIYRIGAKGIVPRHPNIFLGIKRSFLGRILLGESDVRFIVCR